MNWYIFLQENEALRKQNAKLSEENGKLVGHKNHKQRIEYLVKLKKENTKLQEVTNVSAIIKRCFSLIMWLLLTHQVKQFCAFCFKGKWKTQNGDQFNARPHWMSCAGNDLNLIFKCLKGGELACFPFRRCFYLHFLLISLTWSTLLMVSSIKTLWFMILLIQGMCSNDFSYDVYILLHLLQSLLPRNILYLYIDLSAQQHRQTSCDNISRSLAPSMGCFRCTFVHLLTLFFDYIEITTMLKNILMWKLFRCLCVLLWLLTDPLSCIHGIWFVVFFP